MVSRSRWQRWWFGLDPRGRGFFGALLVFIIFLALWWLAGRWYQAELLVDRRAQVAIDLALRGDALNAAINRALTRLQGLVAFVQTDARNPDFGQRFETYAAGLYADALSLRMLALAPGGTVQYVYPLAGNETAPGYSPLADPRPEIQQAVQQAIESGHAVFNPLEHRGPDGLELTAWQAVYLADGNYWGLAGVTFDLEPLLVRAGLTPQQCPFACALRDSSGQVFWGPPEVFQRAPVVFRLNLPDGGWELATAPASGWPATVRRPFLIFQSGGLLIVGLVTALTYSLTNRQTRLSQTVQDQLRELEQARRLLEQRVAERTQELETLLGIAHRLTVTLELRPLLRQLLEQVHRVVDYTGAGVFDLADEAHLNLLVYIGPLAVDELPHQWALAEAPAHAQVIQTGRPVIIPDIQADTWPARDWQKTVGRRAGYVQSWLGVPLILKEKTIGMLAFGHRQANYYTSHHANLAMAIATQAAIAIENARLYEQAQALASLEERRHLARELHDSVSQALYGIALGSRTARMLMDRDPAKLAEPLDYIMNLAEAGLSQMRALIFELRPEVLEAEGLVAALTKRAEALAARYKLKVITDLGQEPEAPLITKEALYRVAQEATHNIVKHAKAGRIDLRLACQDGWLALEIKDDGQGFDPQQSFPGHLGLRSMRERVERLGGHFELESAPGQGTTIRVRVAGN